MSAGQPIRARVHALWLLWLVLGSGCAGTDVGNPEQDRELALEFVAWEGEAAPGALSHDIGGVQVDEVWLVLDALEVRTFDACSGRGQGLLEGGQLVVELLGGVELPATPVAMPVSAQLCRVELTPGLYAGGVEGAPEALVDASVLVRGVRSDGVAFVLAVDLDEPIPINARRDPDGHARLTLGRDERRLLIAFALGSWFDDEVRRELDALAPPLLELVTPSLAPSLTSMLRVRIRRSALLIRDLDQDGQLQPGEALGPIGGVDNDNEGVVP